MRDQNATPIPQEAQRLKSDGSVDLGVREISKADYDSYQSLRYQRGAWIEEIRTKYLMKMASMGKIHHSLMGQIETNHVTPAPLVIERAEKAYMGTLATLKEKFKAFMDDLFKPSHAEIVAEGMRRAMNEK